MSDVIGIVPVWQTQRRDALSAYQIGTPSDSERLFARSASFWVWLKRDLLSNHSQTAHSGLERDALERHERIQSIMLQEMKFDSEHGEIMDAAMFIGYNWVTAVTCFVGHGWRAIYTSDMEDNILADGYLRSEDLHDEHPIQQGMDTMNAVASEDEE
jgi:hypothetical protein